MCYRGPRGWGGGALAQTHGRGPAAWVPAAWVPDPQGAADTCSSLRTTGTVTTNCHPHWKRYPASCVLWDEVSSHLVFQKVHSGTTPNRTGQHVSRCGPPACYTGAAGRVFPHCSGPGKTEDGKLLPKLSRRKKVPVTGTSRVKGFRAPEL